MKHIVFLVLMILLGNNLAQSQQRFVPFDTSIPSNWQTNATTPLALSASHVKSGGKSLAWNVKNGVYLRAINLAIPTAEVDSAAISAAQIFIYSPAASNDTLLFQFFDEGGIVRRQGRMLLNYKGWRDYHRSYFYDYSNGGTIAAFNLSEMKITHKPVDTASSYTIYIDEATIIGNKEVIIPGPHVLPDYANFKKNVTNAPYLNVLENWNNGPDLPVTPAGTQELADLQVVKNRFARVTGTLPDAGIITAAKNYVLGCHINYNPDGSINGRGISKIYNIDTLMLLSRHCSSLARAAKAGDLDAKSKLLSFTEYLLDEGLAEGGRIVFQTNSYPNARDFPVGFLEALPYYPAAMRTAVIKMLKWSNEYSVVYGSSFMEGYSVDYLNIKVPFLFELATTDTNQDTAVRELKMVKRFLERNTVPGLGGRDGVKPDGVGYHHGSQHTSYMGAWGRWIDLAFLLKGTVYKIELTAYNNMSTALKSLLMGSSKGILFSHAESGRNPFPAALPVGLPRFEKFVEIGGDVKGSIADPVMGAIYNDVTGVNKYSVQVVSTSGFHQYNYGALGIQRKKNWVAVMRGFTSKIFGAEIYSVENRYGRYQSYGTLEVLYGGTLAATGYILGGKGWDWNVMPGTTTVHFPDFAELQPLKGTAMEFQNNNFAGSLSLDQDGIFGFDFSEKANGNYNPSRLKFKKTVFAFDSILVCLGSNITAINGRGNVATNLFQAINKTSNPSIYVNGLTPVSNATYDQTLNTQTTDLWLLNGQSTGYYIPKGNGDVRIVRGIQSTPKESVTNPSLPNSYESANASKAWISHGTNPTDRKYHFVAVPGTTPQAMQALATQFAADTLYHVLKQTDTMHIVKYNPKSLTAYVFFKANANVNIGYVKSVSDVCMAGLKEAGDTLLVTINSPDMKIQTETAYNYYWRAQPRIVNLVLNGNWDILENPYNVTFNSQSTTFTAAFNLEHGFSKTIKLIKHQAGLPSKSYQPLPDKQGKAYSTEGFSKIKKFKIYPNPATKDMEVAFISSNEGTVEMKIINMLGNVVQSKKVMVKAGDNQSLIDVSGLTPGTYIVALTSGFLQEKGLFVKY
jgi:chondroitin-sulfate-ABC endolyase/exolyase